MSPEEIQLLLVGALQGLGTTTVFVLALFIGFSVIVGLMKLRPSGRQTRTLRGLDELMGRAATFLPPDAPRGRVDQLHTPELIEAAARKTK